MRPLNLLLCGAFLAVAACGTAADPGNGNSNSNSNSNGNGNTDPTLASCSATACSTLSGLSSASLIAGATVKQTDDGAATTQFLTTGTWDPAATPAVTTITGVDVAATTDTEVFFDADATTTFDANYVYGTNTAFTGSYDYVQAYVVTDLGADGVVGGSDDVPTYTGYHGIVTEAASMPTGAGAGIATYTGKWIGQVEEFSPFKLHSLSGDSTVTADFEAGTVNLKLKRTSGNNYFTTLNVMGLSISGNGFASNDSTTFGLGSNDRYFVNTSASAGGHFYGWEDNAGGTCGGGPAEVAGGVYTSGEFGSLSAIFIAN